MGSAADAALTGFNPYLDFIAKNQSLFPWGTDSEDEDDNQRSRSPRQNLAEPCKVPHTHVELQVQESIRWVLPGSNMLAGRALQHCRAAIKRLRIEHGGMELVMFKVGITHDCSSRFGLYEEKGWDHMAILYQSDELGLIEMLEAAVISHHCHEKQCRNICKGGEGLRHKTGNPKFEPPYFCYCVFARADRARWVL